jgi:nitrite reductase/ring-hydroxylating ferredoxin subunit
MRERQHDLVRAGTVEELQAKGRMVVRGRRCPILVVHDQGRVFAMDNRCPHLGFPLHRGSIADGILTCHWHHARFDLASGCTFVYGPTTCRPSRSSCMTAKYGSGTGPATPTRPPTGAAGSTTGLPIT